MAQLKAVGTGSDWRARRWDAVVLGSGVAGLVAATRLGMAGKRVLVVEEDAAARLHPALREPFFLAGARRGGALDACLRELTLPLIDRRRLAPQELALQLTGPDWRVDFGEPEHTAGEWVAWGLAKPEPARALASALVDASEGVREAMLAAPWVRSGGVLGRALGLGSGASRRPTGEHPPPPALPESGPWRALLDAAVRALSGLAEHEPGVEARTRLLGTLLDGGAGFEDGPPWLVGMLRRRVQALYGEFRTIGGEFMLASADGLPGIAMPVSKEVWLGRALLIAAPMSGLARVLDERERPSFVKPQPCLRRHRLHLRLPRRAVPEAMARRVVWVGDPTAPLRGANHWTLALHRDPEEPNWVDAAVTALIAPDADPALLEKGVLEGVRRLLPFTDPLPAEEAPTRGRREGPHLRSVPVPSWDDDGWLEDPVGGPVSGMGEAELRVSGRPPVYRLDRSAVGGFGLEGELLLGWRGGDAVAGELG